MRGCTCSSSGERQIFTEFLWEIRLGKRTVGRFKWRWEDNTNMDLGEICCEKRWIELTLDTV